MNNTQDTIQQITIEEQKQRQIEEDNGMEDASNYFYILSNNKRIQIRIIVSCSKMNLSSI